MIFLFSYILGFKLIFIPHSDFSTNRPLQFSSCPAFAPFWLCPIHSLGTILRFPRTIMPRQHAAAAAVYNAKLSYNPPVAAVYKPPAKPSYTFLPRRPDPLRWFFLHTSPSLTWSLALIFLQIGHCKYVPVLPLRRFGHALFTVLSI